MRPFITAGAVLALAGSAYSRTAPDVAERRDEWRDAQPDLDAAPADLHRRDLGQDQHDRLRGRAPRGERLVDKTPHGHWKTTTLIAALGVGGVAARRSSTARSTPTSSRPSSNTCSSPSCGPATWWSWTTSRATRARDTRADRVGAGAELVFLPPYSPDLNPIEMVFTGAVHRGHSRAGRGPPDRVARGRRVDPPAARRMTSSARPRPAGDGRAGARQKMDKKIADSDPDPAGAVHWGHSEGTRWASTS
jgi:hypothetical protein